MAAGRHAPATTAVGPSTSPSSSTWQHWLDGDEGEWWTDSSDWEEDWEGDKEEGEQQSSGHQRESQGQLCSGAVLSSCPTELLLTSEEVSAASVAAAGGGGEAAAAAGDILAAPFAAAAVTTSNSTAAAAATATTASAAASSLHATALAAAWHQVHGDQPLPQKTLVLFGAAVPAGSSQLSAMPGATGLPQDLGAGGSILAATDDSMLAAAASAADAAAFVQVTGRGSSSSSKTTFGSGSYSKQFVGQQQRPGLVLPPAVIAAAAATRAHMTDAWEQATSAGIAASASAAAAGGQPMFAFGSSCPSNSSASRQQQQQQHGKQQQGEAISTATPAAPVHWPLSLPSEEAAIAAVDVTSSTAATLVTIECEHLTLLGDNPLLVIAAVARATAAITSHPRTISTANRAVAAAGSEPPESAVDEIETALRTAALKSVKQLQPGNSHYWRGPATWKYMDQHPICMTSSASSTAAAAAEVAATTANPQAAADAALAAAHAAGRGCRISDLHAAWLMQRLEAGVLRVTLQRPAVNMAVLEQALADYRVEPIPGGQQGWVLGAREVQECILGLTMLKEG